MEQVEYLGALVMPKAKALACAAAMKVDGSAFISGDENYEHLSHDDLRHIASYFVPVEFDRPLSGLWRRMCGNVEYGAREYMDPLCWVRITKWGLLIGSDCGDVEAAAHLISHLVSGSDRASLWWSDICNPAFWGRIHLSAGGATSIVSDDRQNWEEACGQTHMQGQLLNDRRLLLDLALSIGPALP